MQDPEGALAKAVAESIRERAVKLVTHPNELTDRDRQIIADDLLSFADLISEEKSEWESRNVSVMDQTDEQSESFLRDIRKETQR